MEVLTGQYEVNKNFVKHWIDYFGRTPRMSPYISGTGLQETLNDVRLCQVLMPPGGMIKFTEPPAKPKKKRC